ncbi:MAG TPA: adenylosuccinate lyase [Paludibacteraceae bacterium]|nr:adenylosuccinate lyase [Paludibacteraceae bacterium]HOL00337.1 adenylosuccinate lyase [Paludibacteraceae bacterium]HPO67224.1 adenylosuccinate lyase [Paludibacteraceae bacterium]HRU63263.1 adenylosuccinate lyase [Paludibacteraceae bacterium]
MNLSPLTAISPIDGRYHSKTKMYASYFSEFALIRCRVQIEIEYFIALCEIPLEQLKQISADIFPMLRNIYQNFQETDAQKIKDIEQITNHDVKAVEYFLKKKFEEIGLSKYKEFIHFGLTSQDINNTAFPFLLKAALEDVYYAELKKLLEELDQLAENWKDIPMLARTHGQPATPTRLGKEIMVFSYRIKEQLELLKQIPISAKFGGATGNFNAHAVSYPAIDWKKFADNFLSDKFGLKREQYTTQISNYDHLSALLDATKRINTVLIDLCRDMWTYISLEYFKQKIKANEVGSSTMPHKVNPIDFENAEGNFEIANAFFNFLSAKLPISRLQRDLTDSTVIRNIGVPFAHVLIATQSLSKGLSKLVLNDTVIKKDLENNWEVVTEAIQTILRREGYPEPYEALKSLARTNQPITKKTIHDFIENLDVNENVKEELHKITPFNYTGI